MKKHQINPKIYRMKLKNEVVTVDLMDEAETEETGDLLAEPEEMQDESAELLDELDDKDADDLPVENENEGLTEQSEDAADAIETDANVDLVDENSTEIEEDRTDDPGADQAAIEVDDTDDDVMGSEADYDVDDAESEEGSNPVS